MTTGRIAALLGCAVLIGLESEAMAQRRGVTDLIHTRFTTDDGLPGAVVDTIQQTPDGFLWLSTNQANLVRFDGRRFFHFTGAPRTMGVAVAADGGLWVGTRPALLYVPAADLGRFALPGATTVSNGTTANVTVVRAGRNGVLWLGTSQGLFRSSGRALVPVGPRLATHTVSEAPDGRVWIVTGSGFFEVRPGAEATPATLGGRFGVRDADVFHVLADTEGGTWYSTAQGLVRERGGRFETLGAFGPGDRAAYFTYEDPRGTIWVSRKEGLFRVRGTALEAVAPEMQVRALYGDRDGNLWVGTNGDGLHRFKPATIRVFSVDDGLPNSPIMTVLAARDGSIWTGANCGGLSRFDGTRFRTIGEAEGLVNTCVWALAEAANGDLWVGTWGGGAFRYRDGRFTQYAKKDGLGDDRVTSIVAARDGAVWFATSNGLTKLKDDKLRTFRTTDGLSMNLVLRVIEDAQGVLWAGSRTGLDRQIGERFETVGTIPKTFAIPLGDDGEGGFILDDQAGRRTLRMARGRYEVMPDLSAPQHMLRLSNGDLWFGGMTILRVPSGQLGQTRPHDDPLNYEAFSTADGLATDDVTPGHPTLAADHHGAVWVATLKGVARFDPADTRAAPTGPLIYLTDVTIGRTTRRPDGDIVLAPGTSHVRIGFGAVEVTAPEKIRMQYRLDGVDSEWLDAGRDLQATFSTLPAGTHTLRIRATNRLGVWDRQGVSFRVTQQPFFHQTKWFYAVVGVAIVAAGAGLYRLRVRQLARIMSARFDERLAERTRVARDLHDTLMQTVQGSKLLADHALRHRGDHARMASALEQLSAWLGRATEEGRAALNSLRAATEARDDLADALRRALDECRGAHTMEIALSVHGVRRAIHPVVRDEVYRIGYEAIRNACVHSGATRIDVDVDYGADLKLRIRDDGSGMAPEIVTAGRDGHFGLRGMRERAERIGARFELISSPGAGALVSLAVPGAAAFGSAPVARESRMDRA